MELPCNNYLRSRDLQKLPIQGIGIREPVDSCIKRIWDDDPGCNIQMDVNLCILSQTPCRFKPYLPLHPHMKRMGPHFITAQLCSVGFSVHTNIPSMQPMQQLNRGVLFCMKPCAICCCLKCSWGKSTLMSGVSLIACTIAQTHLNSEVCPIPNNGNIL